MDGGRQANGAASLRLAQRSLVIDDPGVDLPDVVEQLRIEVATGADGGHACRARTDLLLKDRGGDHVAAGGLRDVPVEIEGDQRDAFDEGIGGLGVEIGRRLGHGHGRWRNAKAGAEARGREP